MHLLTDPLQYAFMQRALIGTIAVAVLTAVVGTFVILRRLAFIGEGLAHGSLAGLAIGYLLDWNLYIAGNIYTIGLALLIGVLHEKAKVSLDTAIGILFSTSMALGVALISSLKFYSTNLTGYLFGSVLSIGSFDLVIIVSSTCVILFILTIFYKEFVYYAFDPEMAEVAGLPRARLHYAMLAMIAVTVVVASQTVGIILVTALLTIPAASAFQWTHSLKKLVLLSVCFGLISAILGLYLSYYLNVASGASIALTAAAIFLLSFLCSPKRVSLRRSFGRVKTSEKG
ncbi:ABC-type Mn2+/Zn2+ transport system, permease component [Desulfitobacterium dehalogenans ATCC 51507]|uniref:ABC-type Mn2+/Zn2+ transport system, permease component n=1 Tax=Desulfitobacterium dehalogenans (strain ATCC 51507 / DSM 9161 / JW/IU-DC1) TaxID=756499 RepID=I4AA15_DESDJ|nr:metal ABC transporter permease [Desulfitobacterium dehalogenans]AFM00800.1 ABC-type Mn2+/Zn2+ transport system, permease component [Desulfitobacterium dehalogenans ATCC 51507]